MSAIETALNELSANLRRIEQRHQAVGYKFDHLYDLIDEARKELSAEAAVMLPEPVMFAIDRFDAYFRSANAVPPNARISVPTSEWQALRALLATGGEAQLVDSYLRNAMERAYQWMDSQADGQSKGGHATFDLMLLREERDALRAALDAAPQGQAGARDAELLAFLQDQCIDLRCFTTSDGEGVGWRTVQHHMSEPRERVVSEDYGDQPRRAIREAMARIKRDPYCTGPLHLEDDAAIAAAKEQK